MQKRKLQKVTLIDDSVKKNLGHQLVKLAINEFIKTFYNFYFTKKIEIVFFKFLFLWENISSLRKFVNFC